MAGGGTAAYHKAEDRIKIEKRIKELERRVSGLEHDPIKIHNMKLLVKMAHEKIEAALPEAERLEPEHVPEDLNEPWAGNAPDPIEVARNDYTGSDKKGKLEIIEGLIKRKGYDKSKLKSPLEAYPEEKLQWFFEHLVSLPDKPADEDIPL